MRIRVKDVLKVTEGKEDNEYIITRYSQFAVPVNIILVYGDQESRSKVEDIERKWGEIVDEVRKIEAREEGVLLLGDFNRALGNVIPENNKKVSYGGSLIKNFLGSDKYVLVNSSDKAINGPFTRYDPSEPKNDEKKSVLDLVIISKNIEKYLDKMVIDKDLKFTPYRSKAKDKKLIYTDHYAIVLNFKDIPVSSTKKVQNGTRRVIWNTNKEKGWANYFKETNENKILEKVKAMDDANTEEMMRRYEKEVTRVKYKVFGKVTVNKKKRGSSKVNELQQKKHNLDRLFTGEELDNKKAELEEELKEAVDKVQYDEMTAEVNKYKTITLMKCLATPHFLTGDR